MNFNTLIENGVLNKESAVSIPTVKESKHAWIGSRVNSLYFDIDSFNLDIFRSVLLDNLRKDVVYSMLFKIKYDDGSFGMAAKQIPFKLDSTKEDESINILFDDIVILLNNFMDKYNVSGMELLQLLYIVTWDIPELKLKNINNIPLNKEFFNIRDTRKEFNSNILPLTSDLAYYGKLLSSETAFTYLQKINANKVIVKQEPEDFSEVDSIYLYNDTNIIINKKINDVFYRDVYSANSGILFFTCKDVIKDANTFSRTIGNSVFIISSNKVTDIFNHKELSAIKYYDPTYKASSNPFIGTIDLETYVDTDGYSKVYALGFYSNSHKNMKQSPTLYYLSSYSNSSELVLDCIDNMLVSKYNGYTFYAHNFGGFDAIFILKILKEANINKGFEYYKIKHTFRDNKILDMEIKTTVETRKLVSKKIKKDGKNVIVQVEEVYNPTYTICIVDSYSLLSGSLYNLSRSFNLEVTKGYFPHAFVNRDTLSYVGNTPDFKYYDVIDQKVIDDKFGGDIVKYEKYKVENNLIDILDYNGFFKDNWNLKDECLSYLNKDLLSLYNIMDTFNKYVYLNYGLQMTNSLTISRLALNIYLKKYLKDHKIPIIRKNMYNDIKKAYFGGITEVYKPYGKNLYYYDVNSLYPFAALNAMPGIHCTYIEDLNYKGIELKDLFGFFYCEIETNNDYLGLLPVHNNLELIMPNGKWKGWYFTEELKFAAEHGYKIKVIKGYNFNKETDIFNEYVNDLYKIKSISKGSNRVIIKSLLNNLLGRFGININKPVSEIVNKDKLNLLLSTSEVLSPINITDEDLLVTYYPDISKSICEWHQLDYIKVLNSKHAKDLEKDKEFKDVSLVIAAAVTSYARVYMSKIKLDILNKGGLIYYTDTDSIVTDKPIDKNLIGDGLGQFKLEYLVKKGYFISSKTYCLVLNDRSVIIKTKGLNNNSLTLNDFKNMYKGINVKGVKKYSIVNYTKGSVVIDKKDIYLNYNSYRKREKIYQDKKWVNTKPLYYNDGFDYNKNSVNSNIQSLHRPKLQEKSSIYKSNNKGYSTNNNKLLFYSIWLDSKYIKYFINKLIYYFIILVIILLILYLHKSHISEGIELCNNIYKDYITEVHNIKINKIKFILNNSIRTNYNNSLTNTLYNSYHENKLSKFIDLSKDWKQSYIDYLKYKRPSLNIVSSILDSKSHQVSSSPILNHTYNNLNDFLYNQVRGARPDIINNPLGISGIHHDIDEVISMLDNYQAENRRHSLELLNYQSNIMYIIVNRLSPSLY